MVFVVLLKILLTEKNSPSAKPFRGLERPRTLASAKVCLRELFASAKYLLLMGYFKGTFRKDIPFHKPSAARVPRTFLILISSFVPPTNYLKTSGKKR